MVCSRTGRWQSTPEKSTERTQRSIRNVRGKSGTSEHKRLSVIDVVEKRTNVYVTKAWIHSRDFYEEMMTLFVDRIVVLDT